MRRALGPWLIAAACTDPGPTIEAPPTPPNRPPAVAQLDDVQVAVRDPVTLAVRASDPDGDALTYAWSLRGTPWGSAVDVDGEEGPSLTFVPDRGGPYAVDAVVSDGELDVRVTAIVHVMEGHPVAVAGPDRTVAVGRRTWLDGSTSYDEADLPVVHAWALRSRPAKSFTAIDADGAWASLQPDQPGDYRVELVVHNGSVASDPATVTLRAVPDELGDIGDVAAGDLRPGRVYVLGTPADGVNGAVAHWSRVSEVVGAVPHRVATHLDHQGNVLYASPQPGEGRAYRMVCDDCPGWNGQTELIAPEANDELVEPGPDCGPGRNERLVPGPTGRVLALCRPDDGRSYWVDDQGRSVDAPFFDWGLRWYGQGDVALTASGRLIDFATGTTTFVDPLLDPILAGRAVPDGFWAVAGDTLWHVDSATSTATPLDAYARPVLPEGYQAAFGVLDDEGTFFHLPTVYGSSLGQHVGSIVRRRRDGVADVVFDGSRNPRGGELAVRQLITGP